MSDILSSPCWIKVDAPSVDPRFTEIYDLFVDSLDRYGGPLMRHKMCINAADFRIAYLHSPPTRCTSRAPTTDASSSPTSLTGSSSSGFPYLLAVPFTVSPALCDALVSDGSEITDPSTLFMTESAVTALVDMITSFHIILTILPATNGHVSLSIQANHMAPLLCGNTYLAVSRLDKMGRRIAYTHVDFMDCRLRPVQDGATAAPPPMNTTAELVAALKNATTVLSSVTHIKSIMSTKF